MRSCCGIAALRLRVTDANESRFLRPDAPPFLHPANRAAHKAPHSAISPIGKGCQQPSLHRNLELRASVSDATHTRAEKRVRIFHPCRHGGTAATGFQHSHAPVAHEAGLPWIIFQNSPRRGARLCPALRGISPARPNAELFHALLVAKLLRLVSATQPHLRGRSKACCVSGFPAQCSA